MDAQTRASQRPERPAGRPVLAAAGLAVACLLTLAPAGALAAPAGDMTFMNSAESGKFRDGRLTLRGAGIGRVTWVHQSGRSGAIRVAMMHRMLFSPRRPTAALHISARSGGRELALRLSRPRYNAVRDSVSYRIKRLTNGTGSSRPAHASQAPVPRRFGAAALAIVGGGGQNCTNGVINNTGTSLQVVSVLKWDTDDWVSSPNPGLILPNGGTLTWESEGGIFRGCGNTVVLQVVGDPSATFTTIKSIPWTDDPFAATCTCSSAPGGSCQYTGIDSAPWSLWRTGGPGGQVAHDPCFFVIGGKGASIDSKVAAGRFRNRLPLSNQGIDFGR
jgi:hypothetical protein